MTHDQTIVITGARGMIGHHVRCHLFAAGYRNLFVTQRTDLQSKESFSAFLKALPSKPTAIIHCAGVNRPESEDDFVQNASMAAHITAALQEHACAPDLIYTNTIKSADDTPYGRSKKQAADLLAQWAGQNSARYLDMVLPNIFGEYARPHYNSVVATFSHQLMIGETPEVLSSSHIPLAHASLVCADILRFLEGGEVAQDSVVRQSRDVLIPALAETLKKFHDTYVNQNIFPVFQDDFNRALFNTFRSYLPESYQPRPLEKKTDDRGFLIEAVKTHRGGQGFTSLSHTGVTRGNHFHLHKVERFLVIGGQAQIKIRPLFSGDIQTYDVSGDTPVILDMPTLCVHNITNMGGGDMLAQFWADEIFDPAAPDTYACMVDDGEDIAR